MKFTAERCTCYIFPCLELATFSALSASFLCILLPKRGLTKITLPSTATKNWAGSNSVRTSESRREFLRATPWHFFGKFEVSATIIIVSFGPDLRVLNCSLCNLNLRCVRALHFEISVDAISARLTLSQVLRLIPTTCLWRVDGRNVENGKLPGKFGFEGDWKLKFKWIIISQRPFLCTLFSTFLSFTLNLPHFPKILSITSPWND